MNEQYLSSFNRFINSPSGWIIEKNTTLKLQLKVVMTEIVQNN